MLQERPNLGRSRPSISNSAPSPFAKKQTFLKENTPLSPNASVATNEGSIQATDTSKASRDRILLGVGRYFQRLRNLKLSTVVSVSIGFAVGGYLLNNFAKIAALSPKDAFAIIGAVTMVAGTLRLAYKLAILPGLRLINRAIKGLEKRNVKSWLKGEPNAEGKGPMLLRLGRNLQHIVSSSKLLKNTFPDADSRLRSKVNSYFSEKQTSRLRNPDLNLKKVFESGSEEKRIELITSILGNVAYVSKPEQNSSSTDKDKISLISSHCQKLAEDGTHNVLPELFSLLSFADQINKRTSNSIRFAIARISMRGFEQFLKDRGIPFENSPQKCWIKIETENLGKFHPSWLSIAANKSPTGMPLTRQVIFNFSVPPSGSAMEDGSIVINLGQDERFISNSMERALRLESGRRDSSFSEVLGHELVHAYGRAFERHGVFSWRKIRSTFPGEAFKNSPYENASWEEGPAYEWSLLIELKGLAALRRELRVLKQSPHSTDTEGLKLICTSLLHSNYALTTGTAPSGNVFSKRFNAISFYEPICAAADQVMILLSKADPHKNDFRVDKVTNYFDSQILSSCPGLKLHSAELDPSLEVTLQPVPADLFSPKGEVHLELLHVDPFRDPSYVSYSFGLPHNLEAEKLSALSSAMEPRKEAQAEELESLAKCWNSSSFSQVSEQVLQAREHAQAQLAKLTKVHTTARDLLPKMMMVADFVESDKFDQSSCRNLTLFLLSVTDKLAASIRRFEPGERHKRKAEFPNPRLVDLDVAVKRSYPS